MSERGKFEIKSIEYPRSAPLASVEPIEESGISAELVGRAGLSEFIEFPLLKACQLFYDKGIETLMSSANKKDVNSDVYISINYSNLTPENQTIARQFGEPEKQTHFGPDHEREVIRFYFPANPNVTVGEFSDYFVEVASAFVSQKKPRMRIVE